MMKVIETEEKVIVRKKKAYIAQDGTKFESEKKCLEHEESIRKEKELDEKITKYRNRFKFKTIKLYNFDDGDTNEYDTVFVNSKEELENEVINCFRPEMNWNRWVDIEMYTPMEYPGWVIVEDLHRDCSTRWCTPLVDVLENVNKMKNDIDNIINE